MATPPTNPPPRPRFFSLPNQRGIQFRGIRPLAWSDAYYFLLRAPWWQVVVIVSIAFLLLNAVFGVLYVFTGGIENARPGSFRDAFFFSVQTMGTIGYGAMYPKSTAAELLVTAEAIAGVFVSAVVTGIAFAKFSRPRARILFSNRVAIALRDGKPTLMVRVANERANHVAEAQMRMALIRTAVTQEGETVRRVTDLLLVRSQTPAFILTWTGMHIIDEHSPLYGLSPEALREQETQLIVTVIGHDDTFASTIHARHAYTADEMVWNKRFVDVILTGPNAGRVIDYTRFHDMEELPAGSNVLVAMKAAS